MKLLSLRVSRYRSLREEFIELQDLNLFIGPNASGKSTILDVLRFLHEGVQERDFRMPVYARGGFGHLGWKGEETPEIEILLRIEDDGKTYDWWVLLQKVADEFMIQEYVEESSSASSQIRLLEADTGEGWWLSGRQDGKRVELKQSLSDCALAAAAVDASFPARGLVEYISGWRFFDPNPFLLRYNWTGIDSSKLDIVGRNLGERLYALSSSSPERFKQIVAATQSVLGLPSSIEPRRTEGGFHFVQTEPGLRFPVHQLGVSSGTLRMLALMTALFGESGTDLIGIEEPENHVHPTALASFAEYLLKARDRVQILVTTHSPLLLNYLNEPGAVCVVRHTVEEGTRVQRETNVKAVQHALEESGFGLGEFYETTGFGG